MYDLTDQDPSVCRKVWRKTSASTERLLRGSVGVSQTEVGQPFSSNGYLTK